MNKAATNPSVANTFSDRVGTFSEPEDPIEVSAGVSVISLLDDNGNYVEPDGSIARNEGANKVLLVSEFESSEDQEGNTVWDMEVPVIAWADHNASNDDRFKFTLKVRPNRLGGSDGVDANYVSGGVRRNRSSQTFISTTDPISIRTGYSKVRDNDYWAINTLVEIEDTETGQTWTEEEQFAIPSPGMADDLRDELDDLLEIADDAEEVIMDASSEVLPIENLETLVFALGRTGAGLMADDEHDHVDLGDEDDLVRNVVIHGISGFEEIMEEAPEGPDDRYNLDSGQSVPIGPTISILNAIDNVHTSNNIYGDRISIRGDLPGGYDELDTSVRLDYWKKDDGREHVVTEDISSNDFHIWLEDLEEGTEYEYKVRLFKDHTNLLGETDIKSFKPESVDDDDDQGGGGPGFTLPIVGAAAGSAAVLYRYFGDSDEDNR